jgi:maltooligosyltrehalose synthase
MAVSVAAVATLAGCGGSGSASSTQSTAAASKVSFCRDNATLDKATASVTTAPEMLKALTANQSTIVHFGKVAPAEVNVRAQFMVTSANAAIKAKTADAVATPKFAAAGKSIDRYCGQKANGTPA